MNEKECVLKGVLDRHAYLEAKKIYSWKKIAKENLSFYKYVLKRPIYSDFEPVVSVSEPFWLLETIQKGRFKRVNIDQSNIYILGNGKQHVLNSDDQKFIKKMELGLIQ